MRSSAEVEIMGPPRRLGLKGDGLTEPLGVAFNGSLFATPALLAVTFAVPLVLAEPFCGRAVFVSALAVRRDEAVDVEGPPSGAKGSVLAVCTIGAGGD